MTADEERMTPENRKAYRELLEEYKNDKGALKIIEATTKDREPDMVELQKLFRDF